MTEFQIRDLQRKKEDGTITRKELRRLKQCLKNGGKKAVGYGEKRRHRFQDH